MPIFLLAFLFLIKECIANAAMIDQCPDHIRGKPNAAFSTSAGCIYADNNTVDIYDTFPKAQARCQSE